MSPNKNCYVEDGSKKQRHVAIAAQGSLKSGLICLCQHFKVESMKAFVNCVLLKIPETCKDL